MEQDPIQLLLDSVIPVAGILRGNVLAFDAALRFQNLGIITAEIDFYRNNQDMLHSQIPWSYTTSFAASYGNISSSQPDTGVDVNVQETDIINNTGLTFGNVR